MVFDLSSDNIVHTAVFLITSWLLEIQATVTMRIIDCNAVEIFMLAAVCVYNRQQHFFLYLLTKQTLADLSP